MDWIKRYYRHRHNVAAKRDEREKQISALPQSYRGPITTKDRSILDLGLSELVENVRANKETPQSVLCAYVKAALIAHEKTNCLAEVIVSHPGRFDFACNVSDDKTKQPLIGVPISLKDMINVAGYDTSISMSAKTFQPAVKDAPIVRLLRDAGASLYVKTTVPITMLSFETASSLWGTTTNPYNIAYSPGGSSGGEAALICLGGSRVGVGSDLAGSVRVPAHFSGIFALKCSSGRWPKLGIGSAGPGQEGIPSVLSPMAKTLDDLTYFTKSVIQMEPWKYDHGVISLPWRQELIQQMRSELAKTTLRIGVMKSDGVVTLTPACSRAIEIVSSSLRNIGYDVREVEPPCGDHGEYSPLAGLTLAAQLINSDGGRTIRALVQPGERLVQGADGLVRYMGLPRIIRRVYILWVRYVRKDLVWANLLEGLAEKSCFEQWKLVVKREAFRARWFAWWNQELELDFLITAPNASPSVPHGAMKESGASCSYAVLYNLLDYTTGVLPVTHVDKEKDGFPSDFDFSKSNGIEMGVYKSYDATKMHGLPVGVQIVGKRLDEERVLTMMGIVQEALKVNGHHFKTFTLE